MFSVLADSDAHYVMMYCKNPTGRADLDKRNHKEKDIVKIVTDFFDLQIPQALQAGMRREQLMLDPGMGSFVSIDPDDSRALLKAIPLLRERYGLPLYVGTSRK
jgi:dihydropteroate synthase